MRESDSKKVHDTDFSMRRFTQNGITDIPGGSIMAFSMASGKNKEFRHDIRKTKQEKRIR